MNEALNPAFDPRIAEWLEADPSDAPPGLLDTVLAATPSIPQRRGSFAPWRFFQMNMVARVAIVAAAVAIALGALYVLGPRESVGPPPVTTPATSKSPAPSCASTFPTGGGSLQPCTYATSKFGVPFTITGRANWRVTSESSSTVQLEVILPKEPANATVLAASVTVVDRTFEQPCHAPDASPGPSTPYVGTTPADFWAWLAANVPMVTFEAPSQTAIGGLPGLQAVSTTKVNQLIAACQGAWWVDIVDLGNGESDSIAENPGAERITALVVDGKTLLVHLGIGSSGAADETDSAFFPTFATEADQLFATLRFASPAP